MQESLTISEVARRSGLKSSAIRYYESLHLLPEPQRVSGQRRYQPAIIERLSFIQTARNLGFSLSEIHSLLAEPSPLIPLHKRWQDLARKKLGEVKSLIQEAQQIQRRLEDGLDCSCSDLEGCIDCVMERCQ